MVTFVATAYKETIDSYQFISSLLLQNDSRWKCIIYSDEYNEYIEKSVNFFNDQRIKLIFNEQPTKFWGHYNRQKTLELIDTEFVIQTSIQDYYLPITVSELLKYQDKDLVMFNCIHNHFHYNVLNSSPQIGRIDWGSFMIRTDFAKKIGINKPESNVCDGIFIENCLRIPNLKIEKINKILTVHN